MNKLQTNVKVFVGFATWSCTVGRFVMPKYACDVHGAHDELALH